MIKDYELSQGVLLAADYGVAQRRPRTIVIGSAWGRSTCRRRRTPRSGPAGLQAVGDRPEPHLRAAARRP